MPTSCSAIGCKNRFTPGSGIKFHRFPLLNKNLLKKWIIAVGREDFSPNVSTRICSDHFQEDDYKIRGKSRVLKEDAVPSIFQSYNQRKKKVPMKSRQTEISVRSISQQTNAVWPEARILSVRKFSDACVQTYQTMTLMKRRNRKIKTLKQTVRRQTIRINTLKGLLKRYKNENLAMKRESNVKKFLIENFEGFTLLKVN